MRPPISTNSRGPETVGSRFFSAVSTIQGQRSRSVRSTTRPPTCAFFRLVRASSNSPGLRTNTVLTCTPSVRPAASVPLTACLTTPALARKATRGMLGTIALRNSILFAAISATVAECPVILPPARASPATKPSSTGTEGHDDGNRLRCLLGGSYRWGWRGDNHVDFEPNEVGRKTRKLFKPAVRISGLDRRVLSLDVAEGAQALAEGLTLGGISCRRERR